MDISSIEVFLAILKELSISKAADSLHLSQSTVSHRLKMLENEVGFSLIERQKGKKKVVLTPKGKDFVPIAQRWSNLWKETLALQKSNPRPLINIGSVDSLNTSVLQPLYHQLIQHSPHINVQIITKTSLELYEMVEKRELDMGFVLREVNNSNIIIEPIFSESMVVVCLANNNHHKYLHPLDLNPHHEIFFSWSPTYVAWHNRWWDPNITPHIEVDTTSLVLGLMRDPEQWSIVPMSLAQSFVSTGKFQIFELSDPPPNRVCYKITHRFAYTESAASNEIVDQYIQAIWNV